MILLYCMIWTYDMITSLCSGVILSEFINNQTHSMGKTGGDTFPLSFTPPVSFRLVLTAFENFEYPWDA